MNISEDIPLNEFDKIFKCHTSPLGGNHYKRGNLNREKAVLVKADCRLIECSF